MPPIPVLEPDARTLHGWFDRDLPPALTVDPGTTVRFAALDSGWSAGPHVPGQERRRVAEHVEGSGHALTGPVEVRGARPGTVLEVRVDAVVPGAWGTTYAGTRSTAWAERLGVAGHPAVVGWEIDWDEAAGTGTARSSTGATVTARPFLGVMGMPPAEPGRHSTVPPRWHGGNLDCRELVAGATLYLPVPVDGALFSVGDGHAAQGDGEVSGTAIECPVERADLTLGVHEHLFDGLTLTTPVARTPAGWVAMGVGDDLDEAAAEAMDAMLDLMGALHGVGRSEALALASVVVDLRVTQVANQVFGVHAVLPDGALR
jgi:acetamidase/formamidase